MRNSSQARREVEAGDAGVQQLERVDQAAVAGLAGANEPTAEPDSRLALVLTTALTLLLAGGLVWQLATSLEVPSVF